MKSTGKNKERGCAEVGKVLQQFKIENKFSPGNPQTKSDE